MLVGSAFESLMIGLYLSVSESAPKTKRDLLQAISVHGQAPKMENCFLNKTTFTGRRRCLCQKWNETLLQRSVGDQ